MNHYCQEVLIIDKLFFRLRIEQFQEIQIEQKRGIENYILKF